MEYAQMFYRTKQKKHIRIDVVVTTIKRRQKITKNENEQRRKMNNKRVCVTKGVKTENENVRLFLCNPVLLSQTIEMFVFFAPFFLEHFVHVLNFRFFQAMMTLTAVATKDADDDDRRHNVLQFVIWNLLRPHVHQMDFWKFSNNLKFCFYYLIFRYTRMHRKEQRQFGKDRRAMKKHVTLCYFRVFVRV